MKIFEAADKKIGLFLKICSAAAVVWGGLTFFAWSSDLEALASEYHDDKEAVHRTELSKIIRECKRDYGANYSEAPDELSSELCESAEDEYTTKYGGKK